MKHPTLFLFGLTVLTLRGESPAPTRAELAEAWGWTVAQEQGLAGIEASPGEIDRLREGAAANLAGQPPAADLQKAHGDVDRLSEARHARLRRAVEAHNIAQAQAAWARLKQNPAVRSLADGACYEIVQPGTGAPPKPEATLTLHYTGRLLDGREFIQLGPYEVVLVPNRLAPALYAAVQKIGRGGVVRVYVPPPLEPGDEVRLGIEPGSATVYDVELIDRKATTAQDLADSLLPPAPEPPPAEPAGLPEETIWRVWGWTIARRAGAATMPFEAAERTAWVRGLAAGIRGDAPRIEPEKLRPLVIKFVAEERRKVRAATRQKRQEERAQLWAELSRNPHVATQPDGLCYEIVEPGTGPHPKTGDTVTVEYTGRLADGTVFDRTDNEPLHLEIGAANPGLNEGLQLVGRGGRIKLYVPPELGYGSENVSGVLRPIPADSVLAYDIRVLEVHAAAPDR